MEEEDDIKKYYNDLYKKLNDELIKIFTEGNYILNKNSTQVREMTDKYALDYYNATGKDVMVIGTLTSDGKADFQLFEKSC